MINEKKIKLIECPRDAMQGWKNFIPTEEKIAYIESLLKVGFNTIDFGSFVSPKAIPQMADTKEVLEALDTTTTNSKLLAIVANERGAEDATQMEKVHYLGYPFSISETFQQRNTHAGIIDSFEKVKTIQKLCTERGKELVVYISMAFGNPYGDPYNESIVFDWAKKLSSIGVNILSLADTVGLASAEQVFNITQLLIMQLPHTEIGVHLHSNYHNLEEKLSAAYEAGCLRYDGALKGIGGCPMANDDLVGNMDTEKMIAFFMQKGTALALNETALKDSVTIANEIFI